MLVVATCAVLTACGKEDDHVPTVPVSVLQNITTETVPESISETEVPENSSESSDKEIVIPDISVDIEKEWIEMTPDEDSIKFDPEYDGLYRITGYEIYGWSDKVVCALDLKGVDIDNEGILDATAAQIPTFWRQYMDDIYLRLTFKDENHIFAYVIDRATFEIISYMSEEQARQHFWPENSYEEIAAGSLPEQIELANYEPGKTYVFDVETNSDGSFSIPNVINNSTVYPVLSVSFRTDSDEFDSREYKVPNAMASTGFNRYNSADGKLYMAVTAVELEAFAASSQCVALSAFEVGEWLDLDSSFSDFVYNDSDKTYVLDVKGMLASELFTVEPGCVAYINWMNPAIVSDII